MYVPKDLENNVIRDTILHQNNLSHIEDLVLNIKLTKSSFEYSRLVVTEVSTNLRRGLVALRKFKIRWNMCKVEEFVVVIRYLKCLGFGHVSRFCQTNKNALTVLRNITGKNVAISTQLDAPVASKPTSTSTTRARN